jgi:hypothetical protein
MLAPHQVAVAMALVVALNKKYVSRCPDFRTSACDGLNPRN